MTSTPSETELLPLQCKLDYQLANSTISSSELDDIPSITAEELMEACKH